MTREEFEAKLSEARGLGELLIVSDGTFSGIATGLGYRHGDNPETDEPHVLLHGGAKIPLGSAQIQPGPKE